MNFIGRKLNGRNETEDYRKGRSIVQGIMQVNPELKMTQTTLLIREGGSDLRVLKEKVKKERIRVTNQMRHHLEAKEEVKAP